MKTLLTILGIIALSTTDAIATTSNTRISVNYGIKPHSFTSHKILQTKAIEAGRPDMVNANNARANTVSIRGNRHILIAELVPPDSGSPGRREGKEDR